MTPESDSKEEKKGTRIEDLFILLCIISLWPVVLGWTEAVYQYLLYLALAGLVYIFFRRMRRFHAARDDIRDANEGPQIEAVPDRESEDR